MRYRRSTPPTGVNASRIRIVPIAVNTTLYDPAKAVPLALPRGNLVFGHHKRVVQSPVSEPLHGGCCMGAELCSCRSRVLAVVLPAFPLRAGHFWRVHGEGPVSQSFSSVLGLF